MNPIRTKGPRRIPIVALAALWVVCSQVWLSPNQAQAQDPATYERSAEDEQLSRQLQEVRERFPRVARLLDILTVPFPCNLDEQCFASEQARCLLRGWPPQICRELARDVCCRPPKLAPPFTFSPAPLPGGGTGTPLPSIVQAAPRGYRLTGPRDVIDRVRSGKEAKLTVRYREGGSGSVRGRLFHDRGGNLRLETAERLRSDGEVIQVQLGPVGGSCGSAEFGIGCFLAWCPTEVYCLPGPGEGGFQCRCL